MRFAEEREERFISGARGREINAAVTDRECDYCWWEQQGCTHDYREVIKVLE